MARYDIAVMEGDGIGPEVVAAATQVLSHACELHGIAIKLRYLPVGLTAYKSHGSTLPTTTLDSLPNFSAWLLGPVSHHVYTDPATMPNPSGQLRKKFDLVANIRPAKSYPLELADAPTRSMDLVVVRENTEGFYADRNVLDGSSEFRPDPDIVLSLRVVTRKACMKVAREAFRLARRRGEARGHQPSVVGAHKANVLKRGDGLFLESCRAVAGDFPTVSFEGYHIDALCMELIRSPHAFDVIVTTNLFGDLLSSMTAGLLGSPGLLPGLNAGESHAMGQAAHGSAPELGGKGIANPVAEILSAAMLVEWLGWKENDEAARRVAQCINGAVDAVLSQRQVLPRDLGGRATTLEVTNSIVRELKPVD